MNNDDDKQGYQDSTETKRSEKTSASEPFASFTTLHWRDQDLLLRKMWEQGKTQSDIAKILNRSPAAVMTRAARLGLPRRSVPGRKLGGKNSIDISQNSESKFAYKRKNKTVYGSGEEITERVCLMCLRKFNSLGKYNRICPDCKGSTEYRAAESLAEVHFGN